MLSFNFDQVIWLGLSFGLLLGFMQFWFIPKVRGVLDRRAANLQQVDNKIESLNVKIKQLSFIYEQKINDSIKIIRKHKVNALVQKKQEIYQSYLEQIAQIHKDHQNSKQYLDLQFQQQKEKFLIHIDEFVLLFLKQVNMPTPPVL